MTSSDLHDVAAIVVHHKNYGAIGQTVRALVDQGIPPSRVLVIDNSEEPERRNDLTALLPPKTRMLFIANQGYGNAVNAGLSFWEENEQPGAVTFLVVATHEAVVQADAIRALRDGLTGAQSAAAAGPTLVTGEDDELVVWSTGGRFSRLLEVPRHYGHKSPFDRVGLSRQAPQTRPWLDGAFVMYRWASIRGLRFDESFIMYMEETELHLRLSAAGSDLIWVPSSFVWQSSGGIPPFYLSRNLRLLYKRRNRRLLGSVAVPVDLIRRVLSGLRRGRVDELLPLSRGLVAPLPPPDYGFTQTTIINPLGAALHNYVGQLNSVIALAGDETIVRSFDEPSASGGARMKWVRSYIAALGESRRDSLKRQGGPLLITWPVLGYLDLILIRLFYRRPAWLVIHDPEPLVRAVGYSAISRFLAKIFVGDTALIVHSSVARTVVEQQAVRASVTFLPLPMFPPVAHKTEENTRTRPIVRVLGQYKPDRDVSLLQQIGSKLAESHQLEIYGRGWPDVEGWSVTEGFLSEPEMAEVISSSDVIVIPYSRFFQSAIAIRGLERGVPVVGPRESSLKDLLGEDSSFLVSSQGAEHGAAAWIAAIEIAALPASRAEAHRISTIVHNSTVGSWKEWISGGAQTRQLVNET